MYVSNMKHFLTILFLIVVIIARSQTPATDASWSIHYDEDFSTWDNYWWQVEGHANSSGWLMPYTAWGDETFVNSHVFTVGDSAPLNLVMDTIEIAWPPETVYQSGGLVTNVHDNLPETFGFGYYEAQIKLPLGHGLWPAFWLFNNDTVQVTPVWECYRQEEIDIMESLQDPYYDNEYYYGYNLWWEKDNILCQSESLSGSGITPAHEFELDGPITDWHTYAVDWSPELLVYYVDGQPVRELFFHEGIPIVDNTQIHLTFQFDEDFYWGVSPLPSWPCTMQVNFVKVWELTAATNCDNSSSHEDITTQTQLNNYDHEVRYSVKINPSSNITVSNNTDVTFRASNHIELAKNFTVDIGESATFLIHGCPP